MDEVVLYDMPDDENEVRRRNAETEIVNNFQFNQIDEDPYTVTDESSSSEENEEQRTMRKRIREELGLEDEDEALIQAFRLLQRGRIGEFLNSRIIQHKFRPAMVVLEHIQNPRIRNLVWDLLWQKELKIQKIQHYTFNGKCLACEKERSLSYVFRQKLGDKYIGIMGCDCFEVRFQKLIELRDLCFALAEQVDEIDFFEGAQSDLQEMMDRINQAEAEMKRRYPKN